MAENKYISELSGNTNPSLTGYTVYDDGRSTYKVTLQTLKDTLAISGSNETYTPLEYFNDLTSSVNNLISNTGSYLTSLPDDLISGSSQIADLGYAITGSNTFFGNQTIRGTVIIGTGSLHSGEPEVLSVSNSGSFNIAYFTGESDTYSQINIQNISDNSGASTDLVLTADNGSETNHYVNLGINSSGWMFQTSSIGYQNDAYLYNVGQDMYIGVMDPASPDHGHLHLFSEGLWYKPSINIVESGSVGFNTGSVTTGFTYEFSGSAKFVNSIQTSNISSSSSLNLVTNGENVNILGSNLVIPNGGINTSFNLTSVGANISQVTNIDSVTEKLVPYDEPSTGITHNFLSGSIAYVSNPSSDFVIDVVQAPTINNKAIGLTVIVEQGTPAYKITGFKINSDDEGSVSINWYGGSQPTGTTNSTDIYSFSLIKVNNTWRVLGQKTTF